MLSLIVAHDSSGLIGKGNDLPWSLPADLQYFKSKTLNKPVIMGRNTFESIVSQLGSPLPKRTNIILSSDVTYQPGYDNCFVFHSIKDVLNDYKLYGEENEVFVIGGSQLFSQVLPFIDRMYITQINHSFDGDVYFPKVDMSNWELTSSEKGIKDDKNPYDYYFNVYDRVKN